MSCSASSGNPSKNACVSLERTSVGPIDGVLGWFVGDVLRRVCRWLGDAPTPLADCLGRFIGAVDVYSFSLVVLVGRMLRDGIVQWRCFCQIECSGCGL